MQETFQQTADRAYIILGEISALLDNQDVTLDKILAHLGVEHSGGTTEECLDIKQAGL